MAAELGHSAPAFKSFRGAPYIFGVGKICHLNVSATVLTDDGWSNIAITLLLSNTYAVPPFLCGVFMLCQLGMIMPVWRW